MRRAGQPILPIALLGALLTLAGASALPAVEITGRATDAGGAPLGS